MTRSLKAPVVAVIAVAATTVALVVIAWATSPSSRSGPVAAPEAAGTFPPPVVSGAGVPSVVPSAPDPATDPAPGVSASTTPAAPEPFVQNFGPTGTPMPPGPSPTGPVIVPVSVDGCDHGYGERNQCVPWSFPPGTADGCDWLRANGFGPLVVHGSDRLDLDRDDDGIACGPAD
jgi:hypothetical protein